MSMPTEADQLRLRAQLRHLLALARSDSATFAILTALLTPILIVVAATVFLLALSFVDLPIIDHTGYGLSFVSGANLGVMFMCVTYLLRPQVCSQLKDSDLTWLSMLIGLTGSLLYLSYGTQLADTHPLVFWLSYFFLVLLLLGCFGYAYEPDETYYLGWVIGPYVMDNFFTLRDDIDRAHVALGMVSAVPNLILSAYAEIFGSAWLWRDFNEWELSTAIELMQLLSVQDGNQAREFAKTRETAAMLRVVRALVKTRLITIDEAGPRLSTKGRDFVSFATAT